VLAHHFHLDGSETILIKTDPRQSVRDFMANELSENPKQ